MCILSPLILNLYSDYNEALVGVDKGILINGNRLNNIRYADDIIVFSDNLKDLDLMDRIFHCSSMYELELNVDKTKLVVISQGKIDSNRLFINQAAVERVHHYNYLRAIINEEWNSVKEIKTCQINFRPYESLFQES